MEKTLKNLEQLPFEAEKILELNPDHQVFKILTDIYHKDPNSEEIKDYAELLYNQSLLLEGLEIEDKTTFAKLITKLMIKSKK
jgi:molecular chaperone HtpG